MAAPETGDGAPMPALFEDLEQQALGLVLEERDDTVRELAEAAYAEVSLTARLHAAVGAELRFRLAGGWRIDGVLHRVGSDFVVLSRNPMWWTVRTAAIRTVAGLPDRARASTALPVTARLGIGSMVRQLVDLDCIVHDLDGIATTARPTRVGADFVELEADTAGSSSRVAVPLDAIAAIRSAL